MSLNGVLMALHFNPRTPCGVRQASALPRAGKTYISIHAPLAGCDQHTSCFRRVFPNFNPRTPCGVRRYAHVRLFLHEKFQSTHPLRGATIADIATLVLMKISIHAPLAGCDSGCSSASCFIRNFNPRTPCGVRLVGTGGYKVVDSFQSTHPLRGATSSNTGKRL